MCLCKLNSDELSSLCSELVIRLTLSQISLEMVYSLFESITQEDCIRLDSIRTVMMGKPFSLNPEDAELFARYCCEEFKQEKIVYQETRSIKFAVFKSIFRNMLGNYEIVPLEKINERFKVLQEILQKKKRAITETFTKVMGIKGDHVSQEALKTNFTANEINLSKEDFGIIIIKLYEENPNLSELKYKRLFE